MADEPIKQVAHDLLERMRPTLGLEAPRWSIKFETGSTGTDGEIAACAAEPEYRVATITLDPEKLETGVELDEVLAHELVHALLWPLSNVTDDLRILAGEMTPEPVRDAVNRFLGEMVRRAEEEAATDLGRAVVTAFRRAWQAEADLTEAQKEIRALKRAARDTTHPT